MDSSPTSPLPSEVPPPHNEHRKPLVILSPADLEDSPAPTVLNPPSQYTVYPIRWLMLFILSLAQISNAMTWLTFNAVHDTSKQWFNKVSDESDILIDLLSLIFMIVYLPEAPLAAWALDVKGLRYGVGMGAGLSFGGSVLRWVASFIDDYNGRYALVFLGQTLCAIAQPFLLSAPTKLAQNWFGPKERTLATSLGSVANPLGIALALALSPAIVQTVGDMPLWLLINAIINLVPFVLCIFMLKDKPKTAPSASAQVSQPITTKAFFSGALHIMKNRNFVLLLVGFGIGVGFFNALTTLLDQILKPIGYKDDDSGLFGAILIVCGLIGAGVISPIADRTRRYELILKSLFILGFLSLGGFSIFVALSETMPTPVDLDLHPDSAVIWISLGLGGFACFAILPICLELALEITYPIPEATSTSLLWGAGQAVGVILIAVMGALKDLNNNKSMANGCWLLLASISLACLVVMFFSVKGMYLRMAMEQRQQELENDRRKGPDSSRPLLASPIEKEPSSSENISTNTDAV